MVFPSGSINTPNESKMQWEKNVLEMSCWLLGGGREGGGRLGQEVEGSSGMLIAFMLMSIGHVFQSVIVESFIIHLSLVQVYVNKVCGLVKESNVWEQ